jgi:hypothetical protein
MTNVWHQVQQRATSDLEYRAMLLSDPVAALAQEDVRLPPGMTIEVHESTRQNLVLALPPLASKPDGELDESELGEVAAGSWSHVWDALGTVWDTLGRISEGEIYR